MIQEALIAIGAPVLRSICGWGENALEDKKISSYEWRQLGSTIIRVSIINAGLFYGLGQVVDINILASSGSAIVLDFILMAIKKKKK